MKSVFDKYHERYDAWYDRNRFVYLSELNVLKKVLPKKGRGLEIGVGTGRFAAPLGIQYGIDPSEKMIETAKKRGIRVQPGRGENLPFKDAAFDYAAIIITICFVKNPRKVLKEAYRVLKKKGEIILGIVDKDSFLGKFYQYKKSVFYKQAKFFSVAELTVLLKSAGFNNISYYQTLYNLPDEITSVQRPKKSFGEGGFVVIKACKEARGKIESPDKKKQNTYFRN
ncbi:MAG: class I SAM-dependent methyltransferase [Candidatus Omnitrophica bacterium]|nr:class I SAM-dependent methyltransferase [Candidatus Omnitrophota bacterium]